jgi:transcriptional regulator with XRE-family HTH domain
MDRRRFGRTIRRLREAKGLTQATLAQRVGLTREHLLRIEGGTTNLPTLAAAIRLAKALDVTVNDLLK